MATSLARPRAGVVVRAQAPGGRAYRGCSRRGACAGTTRPGARTATLVVVLVAPFLRFVAMGATSSAAYGLLFLLLGAATGGPDLLRNLVATGASTVLGNELHRRVTFAAGGASAARGQGVGSGMALVGLAASSVALAGWAVLAPDAGEPATLAVVYGVNGLVGLANFAALRWALGGRAVRPVRRGRLPARRTGRLDGRGPLPRRSRRPVAAPAPRRPRGAVPRRRGERGDPRRARLEPGRRPAPRPPARPARGDGAAAAVGR
ncbi:hypothetical protein ACI797_07295 [Geodermatophilus sp. SYSU D00691]